MGHLVVLLDQPLWDPNGHFLVQTLAYFRLVDVWEMGKVCRLKESTQKA